MYRFSKARPIVEEPAVNLTPLIDVVFVILIMFILIAPLLELDRIDLAQAPHTRQESISTQENSPLAIHVRADNSLWYHNTRIKLEEVTPLLKRERLKYPKARPQLFQDKKASFGTYQSTKNAFEEAGFESLDIVLKSG
jgi:biopolymer transport protein ExbD